MPPYDGTVTIGTGIDVNDFLVGLRRMERETERFSSNISQMVKRGLGGLGAALGVREFAQMTATWTDLESRVKLAGKGLADVNETMGRLKSIADTAYSSLEHTAEAFLSNSTALNALGLSMNRQLDLADAMTNALVVSGAKGAQFEMVMNAVSRAMATGKLNGEELNMVLKYGGAMAEGLADHLGISVNELREFASQGKLTTDVIANGLIANMETWRAQAEEMPATISDAFTKLRNEMLSVANTLNKDFGIEDKVVGGVDALKDNLSGIATVAAPAALAISAISAANSSMAKSAGKTTKATLDNAKAVLTQTNAWRKQAGLWAAIRSQMLGLNQVIGRSSTELANNVQAQMDNDKAIKRRINTAMTARQTELESIRRRLAVGTATEADLKRQATLETQLQRIQARSAAVQNRLTASTRTLAAARGELNLATRAATAFGTAMKGLWGAVGGVPGALLLAGSAIYYFSTRQTEAEKVSQKYGEELDRLREKYGWVRDAASEAGEGVQNFSKSQLSLQINLDEQSLKKLEKELASTLSGMRREFTKTAGSRGGVSSFVGTLLNEHDIKQGFLSLEAGFKEGRRDLAPEIDSFEQLVAQRFGKDIPEVVAKSIEKLKDEILGIEQLQGNIKSASDALNASLLQVGDIDWSSILSRQKTLSEHLIAQLEEMGAQVKGLKFFDVTDSISSLESSEKKYTEVITSMVTATENELRRIRKMMDEAEKAGVSIPEEVFIHESELVKRRMKLNSDLYNALAAQRSKFLSEPSSKPPPSHQPRRWPGAGRSAVLSSR
ncbi:hypothetical protein C4J81_13710 [Deltaproteobacteria bacterium Smac51]|nr:hypothetical protein C4J81_13710 [Deltaproteobacteria bacterium Smac51]